MRSLLRADCYRIIRTKAFWITLIAACLLFALTDNIGATITIMGRAEYLQNCNMFSGPYRMYFSIGTASNYILVMLPIYISLFAMEWSNGVIYKIIANAGEFKNYIREKILLIWLLNLVVYVATRLCSLLSSILIYGFEIQEGIYEYVIRITSVFLLQIWLLSVAGTIFYLIFMCIQKSTNWIIVYIFGFIISGGLFILTESNGLFLKKEFIQYWLLAVVNRGSFSTIDYVEMFLVSIGYILLCRLIAGIVLRVKEI